MIAKLARKMTEYFIKKNVIKEEEKDTYDYCFEVLIATVINLIILVVLGIFTKRYIETAIFCVFFMLLRGAAGGYHANTHAGCLLTLLIVYGILLATLLLSSNILFYAGIFLFVIALIIFIIIAPVDNKNKILEITEKKRHVNIHGEICRFLGEINTLLYFLFFPSISKWQQKTLHKK